MASEYHAAPDGSPAGDGSEEAPWDLWTAISASAIVEPGDTLWLHAGEYLPATTQVGLPGPVACRSTLAGTTEAPIVIRAVPRERVAIDGRLISEAGTVGYTILEISGGHTWWWGLEIRDSTESRWTDTPGGDSGPRGHGVYSIQPGTKLINCAIHDTGTGVFESGATGAELYGNLVYHTGWNAPDRPHGPGFYIRNTFDPNERKLLRDNVVMLTGRHGWQAFGTAGVSGNYFTVEGNVWIRNGEMFGQWVRGIQIVPASTVVDTEIIENYSWFSPGFGNHRVEAGSTGLTVRNNRFAGELSLQLREPLVDATITGNRFYSGTQIDAGEGFADVALPGNEYGPGEGSEVFVRRNSYDPERFLVVIFNWEHAPEASVDLSEYAVRSGDVLRVASVENLYGEERIFRYLDPLRLPLTGWGVAAPAGMAALPSSLPEFGVFVMQLDKARLDDPGEGQGDRSQRQTARLLAWQRPELQVERKREREKRESDWQATFPAGVA